VHQLADDDAQHERRDQDGAVAHRRRAHHAAGEVADDQDGVEHEPQGGQRRAEARLVLELAADGVDRERAAAGEEAVDHAGAQQVAAQPAPDSGRAAAA
jgi:hypothetical protein